MLEKAIRLKKEEREKGGGGIRGEGEEGEKRRKGERKGKERIKVIGLEGEKNKTAFSRDCIVIYIGGPKN